ncbi:Uncharacterized protein APZ42_028805 [Daphnia magna]|uniref:Uncharacterized protein n=1 Tax=Daphnia magna TaxID=35525 RepID=A0A162D6Q6_9CRUS|nr:Uncharacterized protein APZ42_028805 [Daphnia magna]
MPNRNELEGTRTSSFWVPSCREIRAAATTHTHTRTKMCGNFYVFSKLPERPINVARRKFFSFPSPSLH